jgi:hypothetical protein
VDDRYQNARDLAADLRACRETLPRSNQSAGIAARVADKPQFDAIVVSGRREASDGAENQTNTLGLSSVFDSNEATMRLAAMTTAPEEVDELAKTLKIAIPSAQALSQAATKPVAPKPILKPISRPIPPPVRKLSDKASVEAGSKRWILLIILLLVVVIAIYLA